MIRIEPEEDPRDITAEAIRLLPPGDEEVRAALLAIHARVLAAYGRYEEAQPSAAEALTLAEQLDMPLGTVKSHVHRAVATLRDLLTEEER